MLGETMGNHLDHMSNRFVIIVAWDAYKDIRCFDLLYALRGVRPKRRIISHYYLSFP